MSTPTFGLAADHPILAALAQPNGAQFYKCALQVNPFSYTQRHGKATHGYTDEASYNDAMVTALKQHGIQVIAITDYWVTHTAANLQAAATAAGIIVFLGFESTTKDGLHILCLFNPSKIGKSDEDLTRLHGLSTKICGTIGPVTEGEKKWGEEELETMLVSVNKAGGICVAAHVIGDRGLLKHLAGDKKKKNYELPDLLAACIPGNIPSLQKNQSGPYNILSGQETDFHRERPLALLNANDLSDPAEAGEPQMSCYIKLAAFTTEGLRQAFLDPDSRIWLHGETEREDHVELVAAAWTTGGPLDRLKLRFNENLNVLIGGRGSGKSSVLETLRYALDIKPLGSKAKSQHDEQVRDMLKAGGRVSVVMRRPAPVGLYYLIERTYPSPPEVRDESGHILNDGLPADLVRQLPEFYSQHEIADLASATDSVYLTELVLRHREARPGAADQKTALRKSLTDSRGRLSTLAKDITVAEAQMMRLRGLRQRLHEYEAAGLPAKMELQTQWQREEKLFRLAATRLAPLESALRELRDTLPLDLVAFQPDALRKMPNASLLASLFDELEKAGDATDKAATETATVLVTVRSALRAVQDEWVPLRKEADDAFQEQLRALQTEKVDGSEFLALTKQIDELEPVEKRLQTLESERSALQLQRRASLDAWTELLKKERDDLDKTAVRVSDDLGAGVRVSVRHLHPRTALLDHVLQALQAHPDKGHNNPIVDVLKETADLVPRVLADACRGSAADLQKLYNLTSAQANRLVGITPEACMLLEEVELPSVTDLELNIAEPETRANWQPLKKISVGQRATALLRLLLLDSARPLLIDQPEDDLDNRFIAHEIVPKIKKSKRRRQFVFATHNANLPVLGDADLIVGLVYKDEHIVVDASGALETPKVHDFVEKVLEGGKEAFARRRAKYNF